MRIYPKMTKTSPPQNMSLDNGQKAEKHLQYSLSLSLLEKSTLCEYADWKRLHLFIQQ